MNIVPSYPNFKPLALQPTTESARRDNTLRERIPATTQSDAYPSESQVGSEKDKAKANDNRPVTYQNPLSAAREEQNSSQRTGEAEDSTSKEKGKGNGKEEQGKDSGSDSQEQSRQKEIEAYKARDQEVRTHEQAHQAAGGQYASSPSYTLSRGPDGQSYATGGEVQIDISTVAGDPAATIQKMQQVRSAALAPAEPSSQDMSVAAKAQRLESEARADLAAERSSLPEQTTSPSSKAEASGGSSDATPKATLGGNALATPNEVPVSKQAAAIARRYDSAWRPSTSASFSSYA